MLQEFIDYLEEQVKNHSIYVWGGQGQNHTTITESWIRAKETSAANANRVIKFWKKQAAAGYGLLLRAFDCSGLGMYFLQNIKGVYKDKNSNGMKGTCREIAKVGLKKGDWVFRVYTSGANKGRAYHIGYVVDDALNVIEAMGRDDGVVKRALAASGSSYWNWYGRPDVFAKEIDTEPATWTVSRVLKRTNPLMSGADVVALKNALVKLGYLKSATKDTFGDETEAAVKAFQKAKKLKADGEAGKQTVTALGGTYIG